MTCTLARIHVFFPLRMAQRIPHAPALPIAVYFMHQLRHITRVFITIFMLFCVTTYLCLPETIALHPTHYPSVSLKLYASNACATSYSRYVHIKRTCGITPVTQQRLKMCRIRPASVFTLSGIISLPLNPCRLRTTSYAQTLVFEYLLAHHGGCLSRTRSAASCMCSHK